METIVLNHLKAITAIFTVIQDMLLLDQVLGPVLVMDGQQIIHSVTVNIITIIVYT